MKRTTTLIRLLAVAGGLSLVLAACGGTEETAGGTPKSQPPALAKADGTLKLGTILPQTGDRSIFGPAEFAGVDLAIQEINKAGGVLGKQLAVIHKDSGDAKTDTASKSVDSLLQQNVDVIVGADASSVSFTVIDKITSAGVLEFSPSNTSDRFTTYKDNGLYFRSAPPDKLQGRVIGDLIAADGNERVYVLNRQDDWGTGLAKNINGALTSSGVEVVGAAEFDPSAQEFSAEVTNIKSKNPDALALVTFDEILKIGPELIKQGLGPDKVKWYFTDGNLADFSKETLERSGKEATFKDGQLKGVKGTLPGASAPDSFRKKLLKINKNLSEFAYGPESYDAITLIALAAEAAKSDAGRDIAAKLVDISRGGEKCGTFAACVKLVKEGADIDYDGASGPIEFSNVGDPTEATIGIYQYQSNTDNSFELIDHRKGKIE